MKNQKNIVTDIKKLTDVESEIGKQERHSVLSCQALKGL